MRTLLLVLIENYFIHLNSAQAAAPKKSLQDLLSLTPCVREGICIIPIKQKFFETSLCLNFLKIPVDLPFNFDTLISFQAGLGRNQLYTECCSAQMTHEPVRNSSAKHSTGAKSFLS